MQRELIGTRVLESHIGSGQRLPYNIVSKINLTTMIPISSYNYVIQIGIPACVSTKSCSPGFLVSGIYRHNGRR